MLRVGTQILPLRHSVSRQSWLALRSFATFADAIPIPMPALSPTMTHGNLAKWTIAEGEKVNAGEPICEIETDKATVDYEAIDDAYLAKIVVPEGTENLAVGTTLGFFVDEPSMIEEIQKLEYKPEQGASTASEEKEVTPVISSNAPAPSAGSGIRMSPAARHLLSTYQINPSSITGTGKHGIVTKADALLAVKGVPKPTLQLDPVETPPVVSPQKPSEPVAVQTETVPVGQYLKSSNSYTEVPASQMRKVIAKRLLQSKKESPHFYASIDCNIDNVLAMRKSIKQEVGSAPSVNDVIIKACALALRDVPAMNSKLVNGSVVANETIDISVAVATPAGLITPIVSDSDTKGLLEISSKMRDLATRARENKLKLEEYQGGCFTVSNLGMFGIDNFSAVINSPQAGILAVGGGQPVARAPINGQIDETKIEFDTMMTVTLSCDRKVVDDADAAVYLQVFKKYLENPMFLSI